MRMIYFFFIPLSFQVLIYQSMVKELYLIQLRKAIRLIPRSVCTAATAAGMLCGAAQNGEQDFTTLPRTPDLSQRTEWSVTQ